MLIGAGSAEYGRHLSELTVDVQCALPMRQLASVMLRQYVDTHWTPASDKFQPPEPTEATKTFIRQVGGNAEFLFTYVLNDNLLCLINIMFLEHYFPHLRHQALAS